MTTRTQCQIARNQSLLVGQTVKQSLALAPGSHPQAGRQESEGGWFYSSRGERIRSHYCTVLLMYMYRVCIEAGGKRERRKDEGRTAAKKSGTPGGREGAWEHGRGMCTARPVRAAR